MNQPTSLAHQLFSQLQGAPLQQIGQQLGIGTPQAEQAVGAALPLLLGALGNNTAQPQGAQALLGALQRDHQTGAGFDLGGLLGSVLGGQGGGADILGHIFGGARPQAEAGLGQATGLDSGRASQLLQLLAPIVLSFIAQRVGQGGLDAGGLGGLLGQERAHAQQQGGLGGLLGSIFDQNGDGRLDLGDLAKIGGGLFGRK
ncbi:DUF937 domain-containing protein [Xylophilus sp.]|uniref:DUF937 domain-containing protein n=1 Tax=Xylophilus sp. TaxID=2653893 RepID=UPI0013BC1E4E|nr:DUF937 domain-containing protein [Xylophilus sp.]KAF1050176.1 MAG: hypothetical protein GAK38_00202 [Xylophilus sp.]